MSKQSGKSSPPCTCPWCTYERQKKQAAQKVKTTYSSSPVHPAGQTIFTSTFNYHQAAPQPNKQKRKFNLWHILLAIAAVEVVFSLLASMTKSGIYLYPNSTNQDYIPEAVVLEPGRSVDDADLQPANAYMGQSGQVENACEDAPKSRMAVGMQGRVTYRNNTALMLRSEPHISKSTYIKDLREGTRFTVLDGPVCADGYTWLQIKTREGATGWSAEGSQKEYYMEPFDW